MNPLSDRRLDLGAGGRWALAAADARAGRALEHVSRIARLGSPAPPGWRKLLVSGDGGAPGGRVVSAMSLRVEEPEGVVTCTLPGPGRLEEDSMVPLHLLNIPAWFALRRGAVLLHASLVAHQGRGFVLAGRSRAGKSTAAARVPSPWEALCDEMVLAVPGDRGGWRAHPFPTWGRVIVEGEGSWDVERCVAVAGVFFLEPAGRDEVLPLGGGEALCLLNEVAGQVSWLVTEGMTPADARDLRLRQFASLARLAAEVPCRGLRATLHGAFWEELLRVVDGGRPVCARA